MLADWAASGEPFGLPPFHSIKPSHFRPAFDESLKAHLDEISAIASNKEPPTFLNTAVALDRAGKVSTDIMNLFSNLCSSDTRCVSMMVVAWYCGICLHAKGPCLRGAGMAACGETCGKP